MKQFVKIFVSNKSAGIEEAVNQMSEKDGLEIISANTIISQGMFFTTVIFSKMTKSAKKDKNDQI